MKKGCELKKDCPFYQKFHQRRSNVWQGIFNSFCRGKTPYLCHRRKHFLDTGVHAGANLMPTGKPVPGSFLLLP